MAAPVTTDLSQLFQRTYAKGVGELIPASSRLQDLVEFRTDEKTSEAFIYPVVLAGEQGITYGGTGATGFALNASVGATYKDASLTPSEMVMRGQMSNGQARRAAKGEAAFVNATERMIKSLTASFSKRLELELLYGQTGVAVLSSVSGSGTSRAWTITAGSWAAGTWAGMVGARLDVYDTTLATQRNANAVVLIASVSLNSKIINVTGNSTDLTGCVATDVLFFQGAKANGIVGLDKFLTFSGSVLGIDNSVYELWAGSTYDCKSGPLTLSKVESAAAIAAARGLEDDAVLLVSLGAFANLVSDEAALRRYNGETSTAVRGAKEIKFFAANGEITILPHKYVKDGDAFLVNPDEMKRIGSTDITFKNATSDEEGEFFQLEDYNAVEIRCWSDQALLVEAPAHCVKFINITST